MKKIPLLLCCLILAGAVRAQVSDTAIKVLMQHRMYPCNEVEYNSIVLAQRFFDNGAPPDSMDALVAFWKRHCDVGERPFTLSLLNEIRNNKFHEWMDGNDYVMSRDKSTFTGGNLYPDYVLAYLNEYKVSCQGGFADEHFDDWKSWNYPLPATVESYYKFYTQYYAFLRRMAASMIGKRKYTPVEDFLLHFYANPDSVHFASLSTLEGDTSVLAKRYADFKTFNNSVHGFSSSLHMGMWLPNGPLATVGSHPYFTYAIGGRTNNLMFDFLIGFRAGTSPNSYYTERFDSVYKTDNFLSWYTGFDFGARLAGHGKHELDLLWGVGYEELQVLSVSYDDPNASNSTNTINKSLKSFYANAGLGYRIYVTNKETKNKNHLRRYFSLQAKYNHINYNNTGGTDLTGGYATIGVAYGIYTHAQKRYTFKD
ncbi:MAG: hypothetical protein KF744_17100 [Taibaiella sp.]|nr:hypothetical protein [Taibaiella sp.]